MFARCPQCQAVFRVTPAQLQARGGMVRCGHCQTPFRADLNQVAEPAAPKIAPAPTAAPASARKKKRKRRPASASTPANAPLELALELPPARPRVPSAVWAVGVALALAVLAGQFIHLYRAEIARVPALTPAIEQFCALIGCELQPPRDVRRIELLDRTRIAPHPTYQNVLRIRVVMVNRASFPQPFPLMEVSLTDSNGVLLARRQFTPHQYLAETPTKDDSMAPDIVVNALLDVTNPDGRASGYEIRLLPAP
jgi:predicted Zn finger-like uncharacterized protein